jgi:hypothetical protein
MEEDKKKQRKLEEVKLLLIESEKENQKEEERKQNIPIILKKIKTGIIVFAVLHLLFEICISLISKNFSSLYPSVVVNYFISVWYATNKLNKNKLSEDTNYFNYGIKVSFVVFIIRIILGVMLSALIYFRLRNI